LRGSFKESMELHVMSIAEFEALPEKEAENLLCLRLRRLLDAGYSSGEAMVLAAQINIPLTQPLCLSQKPALQIPA
jgi:hypothetical protein